MGKGIPVKTPFGTFNSMADAGRHINASGYAASVKAAYPVHEVREPGTFVPAPAWVAAIGMTQEDHDTIDLVRDLVNRQVPGWTMVK
jgi:hypothetical protein